MQYNRSIMITVGESRKSVNWRPQSLTLAEFYEKLKTPARSSEAMAEYLSMTKGQQDDLKDVGGFVAGTLSGLRRKANAVTGRDLVTLDLDNIPAGGTDDVVRRVDGLGCGFCIYSTRKHMPSAPRLRVLLPLDRTATADEYEPCARRVAEYIGMELADPTTFEASRMMYYPSVCADGEYIFYTADKPMLSVDGLLATYADWRDYTSWPVVPGAVSPKRLAAKQGDPLEKKGVVGAFCRSYDVPAAMEKFLPGVYAPVDNAQDRYTFCEGSTTGGAVLYDQGKFLFSHHATDPCSGKLVNAFDLVRLHCYGDLDDEAAPGTPVIKLPSYKAMQDRAKADGTVAALLAKERGDRIAAAFQATGDDRQSGELAAYLGGLKDEILTTAVIRKLLGLLGIRIRLNEITWHVEMDGYPAEWSLANAENLLPTLLMDYLRLAGIKGLAKGAVCDSLDMVAEEGRYNPVKDMLLSNTWDGQDRFAEMFDIWRVDDAFSQLLTRKWLIQCIAMALNDEVRPQGAEGILVPQGEQGVGKTSILRELIPLPRMFKEGARLDMREKDSYIQALNCWVCELGELDRTTTKDSAGLKAFITQDLDEYRTPYARKAVRRPRRTSFCGTVNPDDYLVDVTGNRRFWTIQLRTKVDTDRLFRLTDEWRVQLWAQVYVLYRSNQQGFRLTSEERAELERRNQQHLKTLDYELELKELFDWGIPEADWLEYSAAQLAERMRGCPSSRKLGRVLTKISREDNRVKSRVLMGKTLYKLPISPDKLFSGLRVV